MKRFTLFKRLAPAGIAHPANEKKWCGITQTAAFISNQHIFFLSARRYAISRAKVSPLF
ncbi:hypothetical protein JDS99_30230 [Bacillus cereus group sp. N6]|uniref:hypothetical protein n=1 Tax=Bacillus cereus group sp. N6 TaxID=2794583 RepID=UPI0018F4D186|nr:hypothetical protein [Bacillus cereus group sp. N6]MBJ8113789.1 hypothetical protein [Bacillus cereus group sp. N6]